MHLNQQHGEEQQHQYNIVKNNSSRSQKIEGTVTIFSILKFLLGDKGYIDTSFKDGSYLQMRHKKDFNNLQGKFLVNQRRKLGRLLLSKTYLTFQLVLGLLYCLFKIISSIALFPLALSSIASKTTFEQFTTLLLADMCLQGL